VLGLINEIRRVDSMVVVVVVVLPHVEFVDLPMIEIEGVVEIVRRLFLVFGYYIRDCILRMHGFEVVVVVVVEEEEDSDVDNLVVVGRVYSVVDLIRMVIEIDFDILDNFDLVVGVVGIVGVVHLWSL